MESKQILRDKKLISRVEEEKSEGTERERSLQISFLNVLELERGDGCTILLIYQKLMTAFKIDVSVSSFERVIQRGRNRQRELSSICWPTS